MKWSEVSIKTSHEAMDLIAEIFHDVGASGVVIEDPALVNDYIRSGLWDYTDIPESRETEVVTVKAYLPVDEELDEKMREFRSQVALLASREVDEGPATISCSEIQDEDWENNWKQYFHTEKVGERIVIKPDWEEYAPAEGELVIEIDPGAAFGTGTHPTTSMCLRELETLVKPGMTVFDVGTGSGILSIAAAKLGAAKITAVDYDLTAVKIARENIAANHLEHRIETRQSDLLQAVDGQADLITANIIADIIIRLFDVVAGALKPDGVLLASGIIADRVADVTAAALAHGFVIDKVIEEKDWAAMVIRMGDHS